MSDFKYIREDKVFADIVVSLEVAYQLKRIADYLEPPKRSFLNERMKR